MKKQRGGTILGFIIGVVVGLAGALAVAVYVTKVPVPFMNKGQTRSADQDAEEAKKNKEAARMWISGLEAVNRQIGLTQVMDLSATPFFLAAAGNCAASPKFCPPLGACARAEDAGGQSACGSGRRAGVQSPG